MSPAIGPGDPAWPKVWVHYGVMETAEKDIETLRAAGVGLMSVQARDAASAKEAIVRARATGMKYQISLSDITEQRPLVTEAGLESVPALMIGGVYEGRAVDRHVFTFSPQPCDIIVEPPVYSQPYLYTRGSGGTGEPKQTERIAHYLPDIGAPVRAEVIVPLRAFDGRQHLKIIPAAITEAPPAAKPGKDSIKGLAETTETRNRKLYRLRFDLTGLGNALLDRVGIAVYWEYGGTEQYWMFGRGNIAACADSTRQALRLHVRKTLEPWIVANGGRFPSDVVPAVRFGDECFFVTGHLNSPACSYPLWDYSQPAIAAFRRRAGKIEHPRTWGCPEIYGKDAYAWWLYTLHESCAQLCGIVREEVARMAPGLLVFRNQTRVGVFSLANDHDGTGQELLTRNLDIVHLDPYPASGQGYDAVIPRDMSYCGGLARRYGRPLVPWMQAHIYGGPAGQRHVSPQDVDRMADEQWAQGVDAIMWLGWGRGFTFPELRPESWERAIAFHRRLEASPPPKPQARLAVVRAYGPWALSSDCDGKIRNPADWMLCQLLEVWAVRHGQPYDVFEVLPQMSPQERQELESALARYRLVVSTEPREGAWVIGSGTEGQTMDPSNAEAVRTEYEAQLRARGWLT